MQLQGRAAAGPSLQRLLGAQQALISALLTQMHNQTAGRSQKQPGDLNELQPHHNMHDVTVSVDTAAHRAWHAAGRGHPSPGAWAPGPGEGTLRRGEPQGLRQQRAAGACAAAGTLPAAWHGRKAFVVRQAARPQGGALQQAMPATAGGPICCCRCWAAAQAMGLPTPEQQVLLRVQAQAQVRRRRCLWPAAAVPLLREQRRPCCPRSPRCWTAAARPAQPAAPSSA